MFGGFFNMPHTSYNILIFDIYNLFHRAFWKHDNLTKVDGKLIPIDGICNFFSILNFYIEKYGTSDCRCYFLFDNAKTTIIRRKELDENYKKNRKENEMPQEFYDALNLVELILKFYRNNSFIFRKEGLEADDYVPNLIDNYIQPHDKVLLFSTDIDWCKCLLCDTQNDIIVNQYTRDNEILTTKTFETKYDFKPTQSNICFWKSIYGDSSDNIPSTLPNYPKEYFLDAINRYKHVDSFIKDSLDNKLSYLDTAWKIKIRQLQDRIRLNWILISAIEIDVSDLENWKSECKFKPNKLLIIYSSLNIIGKFDKRIKLNNKSDSIWNMLNGETLNRAD